MSTTGPRERFRELAGQTGHGILKRYKLSPPMASTAVRARHRPSRLGPAPLIVRTGGTTTSGLLGLPG